MNGHSAELEDRGFTVLDGFVSSSVVARMCVRVQELLVDEENRPEAESRWEANARRLYNLADKGEVFWEAIARKELLTLVESVLGSEFKLSSLTVRSANPYSSSLQPLHVDLSRLPDARGYAICNVLWMLDEFTISNGATRVVPGSHRWRCGPEEKLRDLYAPHPDESILTGPAGTVVVMNAHLWHGGTANSTPRERRAMFALYCRRDIPQQQYQKSLLRPETQDAVSSELRRLLALDDPLNDELAMQILADRIESYKLIRRVLA